MIISCDQCHKKFEIDSNLIPKDGRLLECGSCNHKWFYKQDIEDKTEEIIIEPQLKNIEEENIDPIQTNISQINELDTSSKKKEIIENKKIKKIGVLNIIIVFIISFVALIILVETFKKPISIYIPNIEFILNSLHEILRDIILFFKDLIK
tara:strand:+ start:117 stop:569 length:453 start_codon:yes stop_codon:yes gene_type:complete